MKKYLFFLSALLLCAGVYAQKWEKEYDFVDACSCGLAHVAKNGKHGYVNEQGKVMIPLQYDEAYAFSESRAGVKLGDKWGFIDSTGTHITKMEFNEVKGEIIKKLHAERQEKVFTDYMNSLTGQYEVKYL